MIVIVDYGMGNLRSVENAALFLGKKVAVTDSPALIKKATRIIFPGVGHFGKAIKELKSRKIFDVLKMKISEGVPFLGICLGMQLLFETSDEAKNVEGLGVMRGHVRKFDPKKVIVPHMGWNAIQTREVSVTSSGSLLKGIRDKTFFYFAHSFYCQPCERETIMSTTGYGVSFASCVAKENVFGVQFHPEKSQRYGLKVFNNFLTLCK